MNKLLKILLIVFSIIIAIVILFYVLGKNRLSEEEKTDANLEQLITNGQYVKAKCLILSDVIYHDRVALGKDQKKHLAYLDSLVEVCTKNIQEKDIDERAGLAQFLMDTIPTVDFVDFQFMVEYCKPDVNYKNDSGQSMLSTAVKHDKKEIIRTLLKNKANVNIQDKQGKTPLIIACNNGNYELVKFLLKKGADINLKDNSGKNIIQQVKSNDKQIDIIALLVEYGAVKE